MKIGFLIPMYKEVPAETARSLIQLAAAVSGQQEFEGNIYTTTGLFVSVGRNKLSQMAIDDGCDYVVWIDSDHTFTNKDVEDFLERFMSQNMYDVVGAKYVCRTMPDKLTAGIFKPNGKVSMFTSQEWKDKEAGYLPCELVGLGFAIMRIDVLKKVIAKTGKAFRIVDEGERFIGEDNWFFNECKELGIPVALDTDLKVGHYGGIL